MNPFRILCAAGLLAIFSSTASKSPVLPLFALHLGADPSGVGLIAAVSAFTGVIFSIPAGILSDRYGKRRMIVASACIFAAAPFLYLVTSTLWQLALVRFLHGFATAIFVPVAMAMVSDLFHRERGERLGWFSTSTLAGRFIAPLAGGVLITAFAGAAASGFHAVYLVCGAAGTAALLLILRLPRSGQPSGHAGQKWAQTWTGARRILSDKGITLAAAAEAAILFAYGTFETFLPLAALAAGRTPAETGLFLSAQVITLAITKPLLGRFSDRHGRLSQIFFGALFGGACISAFAFSSSFFPMLGSSILFGLSLSVVTSATSARIADLSSCETRGSAMGVLGSVMDIGHTAGPIVAGILAARFGFGTAFITAAVVLLSVAVCFRVFSGEQEKICTMG
ncbi:MAG: MFS transporter [Thermodesulfovibrionales bacterium]